MTRLLSDLWASLIRRSAADAEGRAPQAARRRTLTSTPPSLLRLEARLVFDGAAVDTALHVVDATAGTADASARAQEPAVNPVAPVQAPAPVVDAAAAEGDRLLTAAAAATADASGAGVHKEVAFVDTGIGGWQSLVSGIRAGVEVVLIDGSGDGLAQMADWAATHSGYDAIHVLSHGAEGLLYLGRDSLSSATIESPAMQAQLQALGRSLTADGDLLLYGCRMADSEAGQAFVRQLAAATGADIAASTDATGSAGQGGNWVLERSAGVTTQALQPLGFGGLLANQTLSVANASLLGQGYGPNYGAELTSGEAGSAAGNIELYFTDSVTGGKAGYVSVQDLSGFVGGSGKGIYNAVTDGSDLAFGDYADLNNDGNIDATSHDTKYLVIRRGDGAAFSMKELQVSFLSDMTLKVQGFSGGVATGAAVTYTASSVNSVQAVSLNSLFTSNTAFDNVDQVRVTASYYTNSWATDLVNGSRDLLDTASGVAVRSVTIGDVVAADITPPTVSSVTSSTANGSYKAGDVISVQVNFSEAVNVTGTPQLTLETGTTDRTINYVSGSGTSTLSFSYTVQAGDTSADLDTTGTGALVLNGSTIKDAAGNNATLTLATPGAAGSLGANKALVIDTTAPSAPSTPDLSSGSDTGSSSTDNLTRTTTPTFTGTAEANATVRLYDTDGSTQIGSATADGSGSWSITSSTLAAGAHTVTVKSVDAAGNISTASSGLSLTIDTTAPTVSSVGVPANASYSAGQNLDFTVNLSEAVTVDSSGGTPRIALVVGATTRYADYVSGSGSTALTFRYAVQSGETDANGITVGALSANGGTLRDAAGNDATLTLNSVGSTASVLVDTTAPVFSSAATNTAGTTITLTYGEALSASTAAAGDFSVTAGGQAVGVQSVAVSGSTVVLTLNGSVRPGQAVTVAYTDPTAGDDAAAIQDAAGNDAPTLAATSVTNNARATVTFDNAYQLFKSGATTTFAANTTNPDIDPNAANAGVNGVYITNLRFIASAASTASNGDFQLQGNDVTGTLEFTGTLADSTGTPVTTTFSLSGALSKHIKTRNGNSNDSEAFYFWTSGNGNSALNGLGVLMITKGSEQYFANTETSLSMPADNSFLTTLNAYQAVLSDTVAPTLSSITMSDTALKIGDTALVTFTFSEAVTGFTNADLTIANGTLTAVSSADGGITWTATFTPTTSLEDATNVITLNKAGVTDLAGNAGSGTASTANYTIDTLRPTVGITVSDTALKIGDTALVTFTFSEAVTGFTNADLTIANGTLTAVSSADGGTTWTATLTPTANLADATNLITVDNTGVTDAAGNAGSGSTDSPNYAIDTLRPTATITMSDAALRIGDTALVTFTFSEAVTGFTNADLTIENGTLTAVSTADGGLTWTATFTPTASTEDASNLITLDKTGVTDAAGNAGTGTVSTANYAIDTLRPTATITMSDTALKAGETALVTITFSEAVSGFTNADLTIDNGTLTAVSSADGGLTWTATFTPTASTEDASNLITLDKTGVTDAAGNAGTGTVSTANYAIDTLRPTATITMSDTALKAGETALVTFTFSEAVSGFTNADLTIENGALGAVSSANGGVTWTALFTPTVNTEDASNLITLDKTGVTDAAGNAGTGTVSTANYAIDTLRPTATITVSDTALKAGETALVTFTFSEAVSGFTNADLTIENGTLTAVSTADGGLTWTATFTPTASTEDASNLITLDKTGVSDAAGNAGTGTVSTANYAIDTLRPTATITMSDTALKIGDTALVTFTFSEAVSGFTNADLTIEGGTLTAVSTADGGVTWTATFTPAASTEDASNLITLDKTGVSDAAGNAGTGTVSTANYAIDTLRPTATITMSDTALKAGETALVTFAFNEAVTGFTNADLTIENGTLTAVSSADGGTTWTATFTPTTNLEDATNVITLDKTGVADAAGNAGTGTVSTANYAIDTRPPANLASSVATLMSTDTGTGVVLGTLSATESSALTWALASGNGSNDADNALFQIVGNQLRSTGTLPGGDLHFFVSATDAAGNVSTHAFTLTVIANTGGPSFTVPGPLTVQDTADADHFAPLTGTLVASDGDGIAAYGLSGAAVGTVSVAGQSYDRSLAGQYGTLYLDSASGRYAYVASDAVVNARTTDASDSFTVTATDAHASAPMSSSTTLTVIIAAANDRPVLATPATVLYTDTPAQDGFDDAGTTLVGSDRDTGAQLSYGIAGGSASGGTVQRVGQYGTLRVDSASGALVFTPDATAINALTTDTTETFTLTVSDGLLSGSAVYTVQLRAANDLPTLQAVPGMAYTDTAGSDHFSVSGGTLVAADRDAATVLAYGVQGGAVSAGSSRLAGRYGVLEVDTATGAYRYTPDDAAINALDAAATDAFTLTVSDGTASAGTRLTVSLAGVNDRPVIGSGAAATVLENAATDTVVYRATASDVDAGQTLRFRLAGADAALFDIDAVTGEVRLKAAADYEARSHYSFEVVAYDNGSGALSASQVVSLQVLDVNEAPHISSADQVHVAENGPANARVASVTATDPDAGQRLRYSLSGEDAALFDLDATTGELTLKAPADHEARASYRLLVTVTDNGQPALSDTQALTVWVDDVNEAPVLEAIAPVTVAEDLAVGSVVCRAQASDVDAGQTLSYALTGPDAAHFRIDARTGVVTLVQALDYETQKTLSFAIVVSDGGQPALQAQRQVVLNVTDVVEQLPAPAAPAPVESRPPEPAPAPAPAPAPVAPPVAPDDAAGRAVAPVPVVRTITAGFGVPVQPLSDGMAGAGLAVVRDIPLQRASVSDGVSRVSFTIPTDTFSHTDPQASVSLQVSMVDGRPLPGWLRFDPATGSFAGQPPAGFSGALDIRVVARDDQGHQVETQVRIQVERPAPLSGSGLPAAGQRQSEAGRPGLSGQWRGQGVFAWKLDRDRLLQQARAVQAQRLGLADKAGHARAELTAPAKPQRG